MHAVVLSAPGPADQLRYTTVPDPQAGAHEAVVRLKAAALNHRDLRIRRGGYARAPMRFPMILGSDGAGEVVAVGAGVDTGLIGQAVVINPSLDWGTNPRAQQAEFRILGMPDDGTYAQYIKVPAQNVHPKPTALSFEEAAAIPLAALTAYRAVVTRASVQAGETVLVTGIGGGVASFALQIARYLGARVFVTSGSDDKLARARAMGAAGGVNYRTHDWEQALLALVDAPGVDVVIDSAGGETFEKAIQILRPGGRLAFYGVTTTMAQNVDYSRVFWNQLSLLGSTMGTADEFAAMLRLYEASGLRPVLDKVFPLAEAAAAHQRMEEVEQFGKIVLRIA